VNYSTALTNLAAFAKSMNGQHTALTIQQMQNIKVAFANLPQDLAMMQSVASQPLKNYCVFGP